MGKYPSVSTLTAAMHATAVAIATAVPALAAPSHCAGGESTVFSCHVGSRQIGGKIASLCASRDIGPDSGYLRFSYGRIGRPELIHPAPGATPQSALVYRVLPKGDYVRFERDGVSYVIFSEMRPPRGDFEGIVIARPGRKPVVRLCRDGGLERDGWAGVYRAQLPEDRSDFDMPR